MNVQLSDTLGVMAADRRDRRGAEPRVRWLDADQLNAWRSIARMSARLPAVLERQLQQDAALSYLEYHVLAGLSDQEQGSMRIIALAAVVDAELSRMSHLITRLEKRGLVRREVDPDDGRFTLAVLTDTGRAQLGAAAPAHVARVRTLLIDALTTEELLLLGKLSERIIARIDEDGSSA